jgi:hypothetical protein
VKSSATPENERTDTENWMSVLVAIKYKREPIMPRYSFWFVSSTVVVLIYVERVFESSILNFLRMSFMYLA